MSPWTKGVAIGKSLGLVVIVILMLLVMVVGGDMVTELISLGAENQIQHQNVELASDMTITSAFPEETTIEKRTLLTSDCEITFTKDAVRSRLDVEDEDNLTTKTYWNFHKGPSFPKHRWEKNNEEIEGEHEDSVPIRNWNDLDDIRNDLNKNYVLKNNLDSDTPGYEEVAGRDANGGQGWEPIGEQKNHNYFMGEFDGQGHTISGLYIDRANEDNVGLFGYVSEGEIRNIGVEDVKIKGGNTVGGLVGNAYFSDIKKSHTTGSVQGSSSVGGLVGSSSQKTSDISKSYSKAYVKGEEKVGGLAGSFSHGDISESFSAGMVKAEGDRVGGLVGVTHLDGGISNSYSTSNIHIEADLRTLKIGGLVGHQASSSNPINNSYSAGTVNPSEGSAEFGGLIGSSEATVESSFWNMATAGISLDQDSGAGEPLFMAEMTSKETFSESRGWDFEDTWYMPERTIKCGSVIEIKDGELNKVVEDYAEF
ncbi:MAG: hypothetical protein ACLFQ8_01290 [Candidatus Aenigmatarchaeota archaeon]